MLFNGLWHMAYGVWVNCSNQLAANTSRVEELIEKLNSYEKLIAWQVAHEVTLEIYKVTKSFPREELYGLAAQLRKSAASVPANIAEGRSRHHEKEYLYFLNIARGSTGETHYHLRLARDLGYIEECRCQELKEKVERVGRLLSGLITSIEGKARR